MVKDVSEHYRKEAKDDGFNLGEKVGIDFDKISYDGKSVRRDIMDAVVSRCMDLPMTNLSMAVNTDRYLLEYSKDTIKMVKDMFKGKRNGLPKISDEKRRWIRGISKIMDNFEYAIISGMHMCAHQTSDICPSNISYADDSNGMFTRFKVIIVGKMPSSKVCEPSSDIFGGGSDENMNVCLFETELLGCDLIKL